MLVVAVVGNKKTGKTTTTENLVKEFVRRGYMVGVVKHIHEQNFTIDTPGKDTYRFAEAGAKTVVAFSALEIATIERKPTNNLALETVLGKFVGCDVVFVEGLKEKVAKEVGIPKIVIPRNRDEAELALKVYDPVLAFSGPFNSENLFVGVPYFDALTNVCGLVDLVERKLSLK
jgi:molybdopterin-guanine dinucleotide biosynthesis protein B